MILHVHAKDFPAVSHLETSSLMQSHPKGIKFSTTKPNVIVGPNGSGKSALLETLAIQTLSWFSGRSTLDDSYTVGRDSDAMWGKDRPYGNDFTFLKGLEVKTDNAPALFFRPNHIPGNDDNVATAMMCGYFDEAKAYGAMTRNKSSGQKSLAVLESVRALLTSQEPQLAVGYNNWRAGKEPKDLSIREAGDWMNRHSPWDYKAEILKKRVADVQPGAVPVVLMDEPEQSLDARAELSLWREIERCDGAKLQVIVATHSLYPLMNPNAFHFIEAEPGYIQSVRALMCEKGEEPNPGRTKKSPELAHA
jgi:energy-coupling factor transporter ATP-binding protein EcfA2